MTKLIKPAMLDELILFPDEKSIRYTWYYEELEKGQI